MGKGNFDSNAKKVCNLCKCSETNQLRYGDFYEYQDLTVHHYCLLFAPGLPQNGQDDEGIEGFLTDDIRREIKRVKLIKCCFCKRTGANLGCYNKKHILGAYHTKCAWENDVRFHFTYYYPTYCDKHDICERKRLKRKRKCKICFENIIDKERNRAIKMLCCKMTWFHRDCLQQYALTAGFAFKCPYCNAKSDNKRLKMQGIFFPERDALWELEDDAFQELYQPPKLVCESDFCLKKTRYAKKHHKWKICNFCGANGIHIKCFIGGDSANDVFTCESCKLTLKNSVQNNEQYYWNSSDSDDDDDDWLKSIKKVKVDV
ncbi:hypothetical protein PVAND_011958 [Polypedilum vanderplanki]|uniref:Uncharacterized protein n=1 Tax=Polypedilum vanderplanki TaxID=319348 RepID=A0A9J6CL85_POLVA|nr:hypothetical protein PVAND_011958 [Polypedilum vanderplanki]